MWLPAPPHKITHPRTADGHPPNSRIPLTPLTHTIKLKHMFLTGPLPTPQEDTQPSIAEIVREETGDGRLIVHFLINLMQGSPADAKPCHRLDAARQLFNLGWAPARAFVAANAPAARQRTAPSPVSPSDAVPLHQDLAVLICEETDNGRAAVRFLVDVMQGNLQDFKPHHRLSAARELLHRGFDAPTPETDPADSRQDIVESCPPAENNASPAPDSGNDKRSPRESGNRFLKEYGPFYFESYDKEDYRRDCYGAYALNHVLGSEQAARAATIAVLDYRRRLDQAPLDFGQPSKFYSEWSAIPTDAPRPQAIYGYCVLLHIYGSEGAARVAAFGAQQYHRGCRVGTSFQSDSSSDLDARLPDHPAPRDPSPEPPATSPPEHPPPSEPSSGLRISLDSFSLDSVSGNPYFSEGDFCRSQSSFPFLQEEARLCV